MMHIPKMQFPRETMQMENGCVAIIGNGRGHGCKKREGEPILDWRPTLMWQGERWQASRLSFNLNNAPIPCRSESQKEGHVLHKCDNEWCIEPPHLYLGSAAQNAKDMFERHPTIHQKMSAAMQGKKHALGCKHSPEVRAKQSERQTGRKASPETRAKMSVVQKARRARERNEYGEQV